MNIQAALLTPNEYSRPQTKIGKIKGVVIHWVANPNTSAKANRNFFENRKEGKTGYGSAHYIIDLDGAVLQCIPEEEVAYHVGAKQYKDAATRALGNYPNDSTIGIECTHTNWDGNMTKETYSTLVALCVMLCKKYNLNPLQQLFLHFDITGKDCHHYFIANPVEWNKLRQQVQDQIKSIVPPIVAPKKEDAQQKHLDAVNGLVKAGIIEQADYWNKIEDTNTKALISKVATYIQKNKLK